MSDIEDAGEPALTPALLDELAAQPPAAGAALLAARNLWLPDTAGELAAAALRGVEGRLDAAAAWLALARQIEAALAISPAQAGQIAYAEARLLAQRGQLPEAEAALLRAQALWREAGADEWLARSDLGLTQVLAMQGRFAEAEDAVRRALAALESAAGTGGEPDVLMMLAGAYQNLGTLLVYQDRHSAALAAFSQAESWLQQSAALLDEDDQASLALEFGHLALNRASALTFLDRPAEAEAALLAALADFGRAGEPMNQARARTNLGRLYLRTGRYAEALAEFDQAAQVLIGQALPGEEDLDALRQADELLLEHSLAYVALNLLPEAQFALERAERLFRAAGQPYELGQCLYTRGLLALGSGDLAQANAVLDEAAQVYTSLGNRYWRNRVGLAQALVAYLAGQEDQAAQAVETLLSAPGDGDGPAWDVSGLVEAWLLQLRLALRRGDLDAARAALTNAQSALDAQTGGQRDLLPHLALRLLHAQGQVEQAMGNMQAARQHYSEALILLEQQRATLPLEEMRTSFLADKAELYGDMVVSLLEQPTPSQEEIAAAFSVVERARARALLERLLVSLDLRPSARDPQAAHEAEELRRKLHWLYNQLLGESGSRWLDLAGSQAVHQEVRHAEAALQALEWRTAPLLSQVEPAGLADLQRVLDLDQQALVYYMAGGELMAFVVSRGDVQVARRLCTVSALAQAQAELRFQLGRAEVDSSQFPARQERLARALTAALHRLYTLLIAPLRSMLIGSRWLVIPYGDLHRLPFHALWDGECYLVQGVELSYAPSASVAVYGREREREWRLGVFAGLAPFDPAIPQAQREVAACAQFFARATVYIGDEATRERLSQAAAEADVLHLATHGLFRPDNSFFSALKLADGWIDVRELYRLPLAARLVVLSACESGVGEVRGGDEVIGLARGFLGAGASHVVASLWHVHDESAAALMAHFYRILLGHNGSGQQTTGGPIAQQAARPAAALAVAQRAAIADGQNPYTWAPFVVIG